MEKSPIILKHGYILNDRNISFNLPFHTEELGCNGHGYIIYIFGPDCQNSLNYHHFYLISNISVKDFCFERSDISEVYCILLGQINSVILKIPELNAVYPAYPRLADHVMENGCLRRLLGHLAASRVNADSDVITLYRQELGTLCGLSQAVRRWLCKNKAVPVFR